MDKDLVEAARGCLNNVEDNLYRAKARFRGMTPEQLNQQYGASGCTCGEILAEYEADHARWKAAVSRATGMPDV